MGCEETDLEWRDCEGTGLEMGSFLGGRALRG